jgi:hypothetical protein
VHETQRWSVSQPRQHPMESNLIKISKSWDSTNSPWILGSQLWCWDSFPKICEKLRHQSQLDHL